MSTTQYRRRASDSVEVQVPRRYGNKIYYYSGTVETVALVGVDSSFVSVDEAVEYFVYIGLAENTSDDIDTTISVNGVKIFARVDTDQRASSLTDIVRFIAPPQATININVNNTSSATARTVYVVLAGTIIATFSKN